MAIKIYESRGRAVSIDFATTILVGLGTYIGIGGIVGLLFLSFVVSRLDHAARGASFLFRPMIFFGCIAVWPLVVLRIMSFRKINEPTGNER